ncbi:ABC transporter ATP-binding protein [Xylanibacillus composti]|uniref:ABC transporter ATP-binding protein n=1 Tax=Xylanibacillus composti TaxID=1572762 RepID=A0A8J4GZY4_9BACL|nr:ABC transporter ATP-binding protein [Xylanibacillus composti]MDT9724191.1 ABC transporter ATP-binding protein [Xylanibacillus composti]GIQ68294.1 ABC transporter ATP-binding protein [Xylanibacillus composti]
MQDAACIEVAQVTKRFGKTTVLDGIDYTVPTAQICGLLGPSGAGKSTLVKIIAGIDSPDQGKVQVLGSLMPRLEMMQRIGYMAQSDALYAELSAKDNLNFFGSLYGIGGAKLRTRIQEVLSIVNLEQHVHKPVRYFSGGMKRRLSLAAALLHEPDILILDEPTVGIDPVLRQAIWHEFGNIASGGTTILVTTHVMDEAEKCDQLGMIRNGKVIACGTPEELKADKGASSIEEAFLAYGGEQA